MHPQLSPDAALIALDGVAKSFAAGGDAVTAALREVTLRIRRGEVYGIAGRSGAGKSTLLRMINLLDRPDAGTVSVAGRELTRLSKRDLRQARRNIGMIFQHYNLLHNLSVYDNVALPLRLHGLLNAPRLARRVRECLDLVGIGDKADSWPARLSGGQKQRVAIARALASQPDILLFLVGDGRLLPNRPLAAVLGWTVNTIRSFPFIILLVALVPFTRIVAGSSIGPVAAAVPLSVAAIPYFARLVEQTLREVPRGVIEAAQAMGASDLQVVLRVLLVEARPGLVLALTVLAISFLSYSAVAGVVGGGGIGDLAIRYGYYRFETDVMVLTVAVLVALVQLIQLAGNRLARRLDKR